MLKRKDDVISQEQSEKLHEHRITMFKFFRDNKISIGLAGNHLLNEGLRLQAMCTSNLSPKEWDEVRRSTLDNISQAMHRMRQWVQDVMQEDTTDGEERG